jgi:hypothetical protein
MRKATTMMGNKATGGPFSPLVTVTRNVVGEKDFNKLRGKAISLHSQGEVGGGMHMPSLLMENTLHGTPGCVHVHALLPPHLPLILLPLILHCMLAVIKEFCKTLGVDNRQVQGVIRLAKKNGEWLGFLA